MSKCEEWCGWPPESGRCDCRDGETRINKTAFESARERTGKTMTIAKKLAEQHVTIDRPQRRVVCAACKYGDVLIAGARHYDKVMLSQLKAFSKEHEIRMMSRGEVVQGFIDQFGVFMDRKEAMQIAKAAGQPIDIERGCGGDSETLYSEGLY